MLPGDQLVPGAHRLVILRIDSNQTQTPNVARRRRNTLRIGNPLRKSPRAPVRYNLELSGRKPEMILALQLAQRFQAGSDLKLTPRIPKSELSAKLRGQPRTRARTARTELALHYRELRRLRESLLDGHAVTAHGSRCTILGRKCPDLFVGYGQG